MLRPTSPPVVVHAVPGARASVHRACVQLRWRRDDRCDEPAGEKALTRGGSALKVPVAIRNKRRTIMFLIQVQIHASASPGLLAMASRSGSRRAAPAASPPARRAPPRAPTRTARARPSLTSKPSSRRFVKPRPIRPPCKGRNADRDRQRRCRHIDPGAAYFQTDYMIDLAAGLAPDGVRPPNDTPVPLLASGQPTISNGGKTITFHIKPDMKFGPPLGNRDSRSSLRTSSRRSSGCSTANVPNGYCRWYFPIVGLRRSEATIDKPIQGITPPTPRRSCSI